MSMLGSLMNAYSGLRVAQRKVDVISQNVANAMTDGYGRREVEVSAATTGGQGTGVRITGIRRASDTLTMASRRLVQAETAGHQARADMLKRIEREIGISGEGGSLSDLVVRFEGSLVEAQSRPESQSRQQNVLFAAKDLVSRINQVSDAVQNARMQAERDIVKDVDRLNKNLERIAKLNVDIRLQAGKRNSTNGLKDERQRLVDQISDIIPIKVYTRKNDQIAITTRGGESLLEGVPSHFSFQPAGLITPQLSFQGGGLSGLLLDGRSVQIGTGTGKLDGGSLAAHFEIRDRIAPQISAQVDAFARSLTERFQTPGLDPTVGPADAGLFTDAGLRFDPANEAGLAGRLRVNAAIDPDNGGALWRLRDGLGALAPGDSGNSRLLANLVDAVQKRVTVGSGGFPSDPMSLADMADSMSGTVASKRLHAETAQTSTNSRLQGLRQIERAAGVDTDAEMQKLLLVQNAYAANAKVVSTIDMMLKQLMEL